jgi:ribosome maturation factor RimP
VAGEEVVMNGSSRRTEAQPGRQRAVARQEDHRAAARQEALVALLGPVVAGTGLELESVRIGRAGSRRVLRVVIDGDNGVDMDDVARVSRAVAAEIDDRDAMGSGAYTLEVSSPGVDRPLTEPRHWRRAAGRLVRVTVKDFSCRTADATSPAANGDSAAKRDKAIEGRVIAAGPGGVTLEIDGERHELGYTELGPGQVQVEFGGGYGDLGGPAAGGDGAAAPNRHGGEPDGH